jgi:hypothetical protein
VLPQQRRIRRARRHQPFVSIIFTTTSWLVSGELRQLAAMSENSRCSILFHFEVPGGKWQTAIANPHRSDQQPRRGQVVEAAA